jgi:hypothetical protein
VLLTPLLGLFLRLPDAPPSGLEKHDYPDLPPTGLALTSRSGPIIIEVDYRVPTGLARDFYAAMQRLRSARLRQGAFRWVIARDVVDPELWTEQFTCPTWGDYLHQRERATLADQQLQKEANAFHTGEGANRSRRKLERPLGSVRWSADTPDRGDENISIYQS